MRNKTSSLFPSKKDKRLIKHENLISRIEKSKSKSKAESRRRPSKKLITTLEDLADALPETSAVEEEGAPTEITRLRQRSMKSKPGAMKKKEKLEKMEMERFGRNMAQMTTLDRNAGQNHDAMSGESGSISPGAGDDRAKRWASLRAFIRRTADTSQDPKP